jgi:hypothetical protein
MSESIKKETIEDKGGRRRLSDRRSRSSATHFPERRWLRHRRSGDDRRGDRQVEFEEELERRKAYKESKDEEDARSKKQ